MAQLELKEKETVSFFSLYQHTESVLWFFTALMFNHDISVARNIYVHIRFHYIIHTSKQINFFFALSVFMFDNID